MKKTSEILQNGQYRNPRTNSPTREVELAVRAAREDVCFNICFAMTVILFTTGHWIVGIFSVLLLIWQGLDATASEMALRAERWKKDLEEEAANGTSC